MANVPKKVAVIGLDCALPRLIEKHIKEGHLPTFKKLIESGVIADNCLVPYPTVTPPNWASIATGAWPGTHGITDFHTHKLGTTPDNTNVIQSFDSNLCEAEFLWDTADKAGKKCIVFNYPGAWPSKMKNGIMVGGRGLSIGEYRNSMPGMRTEANICNDMLITTGLYPRTIKGKFEEAKGWKNLPKKEKEFMELEARMDFRDAAVQPISTSWYVLSRQSVDDGYDRATLSPTKDFNDAFCTLAVGEWSPVITTKFKMPGGKEVEGFFRCKLIELSDDAEDLRLYISSIGPKTGESNPPEIMADLVSAKGITGNSGGVLGYALEWFDLDTFIEVNDLYTQYLADCACSLMTKHEWDLFFMHAHSPDWAYHMILTGMNAEKTRDQEKLKEAWDAHLRIYQAQDNMLAQMLEVMGKDTLVILVSDHGAVPDGPNIDVYKILEPHGLAVLAKTQVDFSNMADLKAREQAKTLFEELKQAFVKPDVENSKCFPNRSLYVYVNLKGRDPEGIVDPKDYKEVQQQIIDALLSYVDPVTGKRPISMALAKDDARILGLYGNHIGDVVYAFYPWFTGQHGNILPGAEWGIGSLKALLTFTGPGLKKGFRLERTCNLIDIVPTICYLMDLPVPSTVDGGVLYQAFKNPDFKSDEIAKLKAGLARMEIALQRGERQPWDKHECA
ncbi:MAG: alkaline phosphatase family protein [Dehalococcoidia bacterium]